MKMVGTVYLPYFLTSLSDRSLYRSLYRSLFTLLHTPAYLPHSLPLACALFLYPLQTVSGLGLGVRAQGLGSCFSSALSNPLFLISTLLDRSLCRSLCMSSLTLLHTASGPYTEAREAGQSTLHLPRLHVCTYMMCAHTCMSRHSSSFPPCFRAIHLHMYVHKCNRGNFKLP